MKTKVAQYSRKGEFVKQYKSISEASRKTGINAGLISKSINGVDIYCGHYIFFRVSTYASKMNFDVFFPTMEEVRKELEKAQLIIDEICRINYESIKPIFKNN